MTATASCSDGSSIPVERQNISFVLEFSGSTVTWMAACGSRAFAAVNGNEAIVRRYSCPAFTESGNTISLTVTGGRLVLMGDAVEISLETQAVISGAQNATCTISAFGSLARTSS